MSHIHIMSLVKILKGHSSRLESHLPRAVRLVQRWCSAQPGDWGQRLCKAPEVWARDPLSSSLSLPPSAAHRSVSSPF